MLEDEAVGEGIVQIRVDIAHLRRQLRVERLAASAGVVADLRGIDPRRWLEQPGLRFQQREYVAAISVGLFDDSVLQIDALTDIRQAQAAAGTVG